MVDIHLLCPAAGPAGVGVCVFVVTSSMGVCPYTPHLGDCGVFFPVVLFSPQKLSDTIKGLTGSSMFLGTFCGAYVWGYLRSVYQPRCFKSHRLLRAVRSLCRSASLSSFFFRCILGSLLPASSFLPFFFRVLYLYFCYSGAALAPWSSLLCAVCFPDKKSEASVFAVTVSEENPPLPGLWRSHPLVALPLLALPTFGRSWLATSV